MSGAPPPPRNVRPTSPDEGESEADTPRDPAPNGKSTNGPPNAAAEPLPADAELAAAVLEGAEPNLRRLYRFLGVQPGEVLELQALNVPKNRTGEGYRPSYFAHARDINEFVKLAAEGESMGQGTNPAVFVIPNVIDPAVVTRAEPGRWRQQKQGEATIDKNIFGRRVLYTDVDAGQPSGTSATDERMNETHSVARAIADRCATILGGVAHLGLGHSGNGAALFIALDNLPSSPELTSMIREIHTAFAVLHPSPTAKIDLSVSDPKRLCPAFGTMKRKGASNLPDYPHRRTAFVCSKQDVGRLSLSDLTKLHDALVAQAAAVAQSSESKTKSSTKKQKPKTASSEAFSRANDVPIREVTAWLGIDVNGTSVKCPGCGETNGSDLLDTKGINGHKCQHARCANRGKPPGFRTVVDFVMEARGVDNREAVNLLAAGFGFEGLSAGPAAAGDAVSSAAKEARGKPGPDLVVGDHVEVAKMLVKKLRQDRPEDVVGAEGDPFRYDPNSGLWAKIEYEEESVTTQEFSQMTIGSKRKPLKLKHSDVSGIIKLAYDRVARPNFFADAPSGLAFSNGFVRIKESGPVLMAHSPDNRARFGYAFPYEPDASAPLWLKCLDDVFRDDEDKAQKIACLQEHVGASLTGSATKYQRCVVCIGNGDEGKSTLAQIIDSIFPAGSIEAIPPQEWGQEYRRAMLAGKLLNTVAELPERDIISSESFKAIIAGDPITGRHIYKPPFRYRPIAGHLFSANRLPGTPDQTHAFWRRFIIIRFNRTFTGDPARDPKIAEKISKAEKPGIVSWAIRGAVRIMQQQGHTIPASHEKELAVWRRTADQIAAFMEDCVWFDGVCSCSASVKLKSGISVECERCQQAMQTTNRELVSLSSRNGWATTATEAYRAYRDWAERNGHRFPLSNVKFAGRMQELGFPSKKGETANSYPMLVIGCSRFQVPRQKTPKRDAAGG